MPSSLAAGPWFRFLNIARKLHLKPQSAAPVGPKTGDMYMHSTGVLMVYNGSAWVAVGSQSTPA